MLSPEFVNAIASLSSSALFVIAIVALVSGRVRRESEFKDARAEGEARLAELRGDRDEWKTIANGVRDGALARNVAAGHRIRQAEPDPFVMGPELARRVLAAIRGDRFEAAWIVALLTGLRRGELLGLRWADVDLEGALLSVRRQRGVAGIAAPKTPQARRTIPLPTIAIAALRAHRGARIVRPETPIFDVGPSTITHAWGRTVARTGLPPMRLHDLRHAAATLMLATGTPMRVIADTLGHSSPAITARIYAHVVPAAQRDAADRLDAALRERGAG